MKCTLCMNLERLGPREYDCDVERELPDSDKRELNCPRCGKYIIGDALLSQLQLGLDADSGLKLSGVVRLASDRSAPLTVDEDILDAPPPVRIPRTYGERVNALLRYVAEKAPYPGMQTEPEDIAAVSARLFLPERAGSGLLKMLQTEGLITHDWLQQPLSGHIWISLLPQGWARVDEMERAAPRGDEAFVAMSFSDELKPLYEKALAPALVDCGYEQPFRVDDRHPAGEPFETKIDDRVMARIRKAAVVIVDITEGRKAVYYEAGFAEGLGIPIVWTARGGASFAEDSCFDTRQHEHLKWEEGKEEELRDRLEAHIRARGLDCGARGNVPRRPSAGSPPKY